MDIKILEDFKDGKDKYIKGELRVVSQEDGEYFCGNGWAEDVEGKVPTGERQKNGETRLDIRKTKHTQLSKEVK